jgi:hypothetical protein
LNILTGLTFVVVLESHIFCSSIPCLLAENKGGPGKKFSSSAAPAAPAPPSAPAAPAGEGTAKEGGGLLTSYCKEGCCRYSRSKFESFSTFSSFIGEEDFQIGLKKN